MVFSGSKKLVGMLKKYSTCQSISYEELTAELDDYLRSDFRAHPDPFYFEWKDAKTQFFEDTYRQVVK